MIWAAAVLALAAATYAICYWGAGLILHPPSMSPMWIFPEQFGLRYERVSFPTRDGLTLRGWRSSSMRPCCSSASALRMAVAGRDDKGWKEREAEVMREFCRQSVA